MSINFALNLLLFSLFVVVQFSLFKPRKNIDTQNLTLLRGLLKENPYTYALTSFVILLYFMHGTVEAWANAEQRIFAIIEIYLSVQVYIGAIYYARLQDRALKEES